MKIHGFLNRRSGVYQVVLLALLVVSHTALGADKPKAPPAKAPSAPRSSAPSHPAGGGGGGERKGPGAGAGSHGPTTGSHGPTTGSHGPTTESHGPTTTSHGPTTTTSGHTTAGGPAAGHTTTPTAAGAHTTTPGGAQGVKPNAGGNPGGREAAGGGAKGGANAPHAAGGTVAGGRTATTPSGGKTFGRTAPAKGQTTVATRNGAVVKRPDGHVATVHDTRRGMEVHHNLSGSRRVEVERRDHSRVVVERGGHGYVQRPYVYRGHEYARRSYYYQGHYYHAYYGRYYYRGVYVNPYYPAYYYPPAYYGWVYNPWVTPINYAWGWNVNPWYGYYGAYFTPYPVYASPSLWLTDYILAMSLSAAYQAQANAQAAALANPAPLTPEVKQLIADEVRQQVALENSESKSAQGGEPDAASSSIQRALTDGKAHVFVAGADLDVVDASGGECALSEGDALQLTGQTASDAQAVTLTVLASKGGRECPKGDTVTVALTDLQDMQNHMRQTIDQGMQELQKKQGQGGIPAAPAAAKAAPVESAMASSAPPPPPENEVKTELSQQAQEADRAEAEANSTAGSGPGPNGGAPAAEPVNIELGQTIEQVTAAMGQPLHMATVGSKKIYSYKDMKIIFQDGKVSDIQ